MGMIMPKGWEGHARGREIAVWGTGIDAAGTAAEISGAAGGVSFFISRDWEKPPFYSRLIQKQD